MDCLGRRWGQDWRYAGGLWHVEEEEARVSEGWDFDIPPAGTARAFPQTQPASHYLFEVDVRSMPNNQEPYGIVAWHRDEENWLSMTLEPARHQWRWRCCQNGAMEEHAIPLAKDFDCAAFHKLRLTNNGGMFDLWIDNLHATAGQAIRTSFDQPGIPGLLSEGALAGYKAVLYTIGWDEFDDAIVGWKSIEESDPPLRASAPAGLTLDASAGAKSWVKGDPADAYEFVVQMTAQDDSPWTESASMGALSGLCR